MSSLSINLSWGGHKARVYMEKTPVTMLVVQDDAAARPVTSQCPVAIALFEELLNQTYPGHETWTLRDWREHVQTGDTLLGFEDWVKHQCEADKDSS